MIYKQNKKTEISDFIKINKKGQLSHRKPVMFFTVIKRFLFASSQTNQH